MFWIGNIQIISYISVKVFHTTATRGRFARHVQNDLMSRLGSQVKVRCSMATSWETGKLVLQLMFYLNLLFQNTCSYINWWLYILWHPKIDHSHVLLIVMDELVCFELVYVKFLMKSKSHETRSSMELTGGATYTNKVQ